MGMSSATKKLSGAIRGQGDMEDGDGEEKLCVRALFKDGGISPKAMETRSNKDQDGSKMIETRSMMDYRNEIKHDRQDISKNFKNLRRFMGQKPAEVFRTDFISAMKIPDTHQFAPGDYLTLSDTWRQEWEKGVQVPVAPEKIPTPAVRKVESVLCREDSTPFTLPSKRISFNNENYVAAFHRGTTSCDYDLDDIDTCWLTETKAMGEQKKGNKIDELTMERAITIFERQCFDKMAHQVATKEGLSIEYDETTTCNVCLSPDAEDGNEIIFCDACNMCAHQHCYGVLEIPEGTWLCNPCSRGSLSPPCCLCPNKGGAMKRMKDSLEWIHVICAWWVPEVKIEDTRFIERITKDKIPTTRWNLTCSVCWEKTGACIQCSVKRCVRAYHITCAVKCGLEMKTVVDPEKDDVQHISFCSKHCTPQPPESNPHSKPTGEEVQNNRERELQKLQDEFYTLVSVNKASRELRLTKETTRKMISYWTMKRRHNNNEPLIPLTIQQEEKLSGKQAVVLLQQQRTLEMERFMHLRQDLERLRNLCYMIVRREKMRKELHRSSIDIFLQQNKILLDDSEDLSGDNIDFIRHRTTKFSKFSENYETEKEHRMAHGKHFKFFDDSSPEDDGVLLSSNIERINPEDFDRPISTKSSTTDSKKTLPRPLAEDTPKVSVANKDPSTKPASSRKQKKFINPPTRRSTRLDGILGFGTELGSFIADPDYLDNMTLSSIESSVSVKTEMPECNDTENSVMAKVQEVKVEIVDSKGLMVRQEACKAVEDRCEAEEEVESEIDSARNIFDITNELIESTVENELNGAITTVTVKKEENGVEANTIEPRESRTLCNDSEMNTNGSRSSSLTSTDSISTPMEVESGGPTEASSRLSGSDEAPLRNTKCRSASVNGMEIDSKEVTINTNNIFDLIDANVDRSPPTPTTPPKLSPVKVNGSGIHDDTCATKTDRNIFELLSPKKEDEDYHSWSNGPIMTPLDLLPMEAEADEKPAVNYCSTPCLDEKVLSDSKRERLSTKPLSSEVKENAFDNFTDFLNDQVRHHNGFATPGYTTPPFSDENDYRQANDDERNRKCLDPKYGLKRHPNNCVLTNSSLFKRKTKRLRNILKYEGQARRNSPRLHHHHHQSNPELEPTVEDGPPVMGPVSPSKGSFERLSKLIIETKRRRLNSSGTDYTATKIKEEPPDYVRITRSRVGHSQVTTTA